MNITLTPWRMFGAILAAIALIAVGAAIGHTLTRNHYEPLLDAANKQIGALSTANAAMKSSLERQNSAVIALETQAQQREKAAAEAVKRAQATSAQAQKRAQAVLTSKPRVGENQCDAARLAFDDELKQERGNSK